MECAEDNTLLKEGAGGRVSSGVRVAQPPKLVVEADRVGCKSHLDISAEDNAIHSTERDKCNQLPKS